MRRVLVGMAKPYEESAIRERVPDAKNAVLLVIDMQEYFRKIDGDSDSARDTEDHRPCTKGEHASHLHDARAQGTLGLQHAGRVVGR